MSTNEAKTPAVESVKRPTASTQVNGKWEWTDRHGRTWRMAYDHAVNSYNRDDRDALEGVYQVSEWLMEWLWQPTGESVWA